MRRTVLIISDSHAEDRAMRGCRGVATRNYILPTPGLALDARKLVNIPYMSPLAHSRRCRSGESD
jgi:hypothetical protein